MPKQFEFLGQFCYDRNNPMAKGGCIVVRIGILEDEAAYSERLLTYLKQYQTENPDFSYTTEIYTTGIALLTKFASQFDRSAGEWAGMYARAADPQ